MPRIAYFPGLLVFVVQGVLWGLAAATDWSVWLVFGGATMLAGALAAILAFPITIEISRENRWAWAVASLCISALGLFFGFIFWIEAARAVCGNSCFGD